jgi:hypothetical protein
VPPRKRPVGARVPGSSKSFSMEVISSGLYCSMQQQKHKYEDSAIEQAGEKGDISSYGK